MAEEVRKLAEQSSISTKYIEDMVTELQKNSNSAVETMESVTSISKEQMMSVMNSKDKYIQIAQATKDSEKAIEILNNSGEEMERMKSEIFDVLQNLAAIAEENSAATEQVTSSMEEQTATFEEIAGASEVLSSLAQNLQLLIMKFKI